MWCFIYRSNKKRDCYLYIDKENDFSKVPVPLMMALGRPVFVMKLLLTSRQKLVAAPVSDLCDRIVKEGYFLQMLTENDFYVEKRKTCK